MKINEIQEHLTILFDLAVKVRDMSEDVIEEIEKIRQWLMKIQIAELKGKGE